jgi:hypothetical protein
LSNPMGTNVNPALTGEGIVFNQLAQGSVMGSSTMVAEGQAPSTGGSILTQGNAVDVPVFIQAPTGFVLGPVRGTSPGTFASILQFGIFPEP